jgi:hypothetical protein
VGRTYKGAKQNRVLEVVKRQDGTFELFLNRRLPRGQVSEDGLPQELCVRFGFCGEEYNSFSGKSIRQAGKSCSSDDFQPTAPLSWRKIAIELIDLGNF